MTASSSFPSAPATERAPIELPLAGLKPRQVGVADACETGGHGLAQAATSTDRADTRADPEIVGHVSATSRSASLSEPPYASERAILLG
jgi:hypothetical protein